MKALPALCGGAFPYAPSVQNPKSKIQNDTRGRTTCSRRHCLTVLSLLTLHLACSPGVTDAELARRVAAAHPAWQSYEEDIKAQLGAGPAAEWSGSLDAVRCDAESIRATFRVVGPWSRRTVAAPILMREPTGRVLQNRDASNDGGSVTYVFDRPSTLTSDVPAWLEFRFPHGEGRVVLSENGTWNATEH